jgi:hypothetical protein
MFFYIGLLCATLVCTAYASDNYKAVTAVEVSAASESGYPFYFSKDTVSLLDAIVKNVSPELASSCNQYGNGSYGRGITTCKDLLMGLNNAKFDESKRSCSSILLYSDVDPLSVKSTCEKLEPTFKAWQKAQAAQSNENKQ